MLTKEMVGLHFFWPDFFRFWRTSPKLADTKKGGRKSFWKSFAQKEHLSINILGLKPFCKTTKSTKRKKEQSESSFTFVKPPRPEASLWKNGTNWQILAFCFPACHKLWQQKKYRNQFYLVCYMYAAIIELTPCVRG